MSVNDFVDSFCVYSNWDDHLWDGAALADWTPCFEDVVILGSVHIVVLITCCFRAWSIWDSSNQDRALLRTKTWPLIKCGLAGLTTVIPVIQLAAKLVNNSELAPFDVVTSCLSIAAWLCVTGLLFQETLGFIYLKGGWILRFDLVLMAVAQSLKMSTVIRLTQINGGYFGEYFVLYCVALSCTCILALDALFNWSDASEFAAYDPCGYVRPEAEQDEPAWDTMECPEERANFISFLLFSWVFPLISRAYERPLKDRDVWALTGQDLSENIAERMEKAWREEQKKAKPSLPKAMTRVFGGMMLRAGFYKTFNDASQFTGPIFLSLLIGFIADKESFGMGVMYATAMFFSQIVGAIGEGQYFRDTARVGMRMKGGFVALILRKVMVLSTAARSRVSTGKINNLLTSDTEALEDFAGTVHVLWSSPLRIVICLYLLYVQIGWAAYVGFSALILTLPIQKAIITKSIALTRISRGKTDERVKYINEMLASMNIVKMYAWEDSMEKRINLVRDEELRWIKSGALLSGVNFFLILTAPLIVSVVALAVFAAQPGNVLTASRAFTALALFGVLRFPLILLPSAIASVATCSASVTRLQEYLQEEELDSPLLLSGKGPQDPALKINKATFWWGAVGQDNKAVLEKQNELITPLLQESPEPITPKSPSSTLPTLQDINLSVLPGQLVAVVGSTGSGKSSLIQAILGEMPLYTPPDTPARRFNEVVQTRGKLAYVPQQAWIYNASVQANILFGKEFNQEEYDTALRCACLQPDLVLLPNGDLTEIGEKGVNLSGGQKLRVSLARAIYARADVYLLDDPLAALDAHVAKEVFDQCINGVLKQRGATRILVTNHLSVLPQCDSIVVVAHHTFETVGPFSQARISPTLALLLAERSKKDQEEQEDEEKSLDTTQEEEEKVNKNVVPTTPTAAKTAVEGGLITEEEQNVGTMSWQYVKAYLKASGLFMFGVLVFFAALQQLFSLGGNYWVTVWTSDPPMLLQPDGSPYSPGFYIGIYGAWNLAIAIATLAGRVVVALAGINAGRELHRNMLSNLLLAPMQFYQQTPLGRILNRFTADIGDVDRMLPFTLSLFFFSILSGVVTLAGIAIGTPYALIAFVPVFVFFFWLQRYFQHSSRELKRLDSVTKSPVYSHFDAVLTGIPSIRAYGAQARFVHEGCAKIDHNIRVDWANNSCNRWLTLRLEFVGGAMTLAVALFVVVLRDGLNQSLAGLVLSYAIAITQLLTMGVRIGSSFENAFNAVERIVYYSTETPKERAFEITETEPPTSWPLEGAIEFRNVSMRYRPGLPLVLNDVSFSLPKCCKVGVVGRTGAGKSSMFLSLFRIVELSAGSVWIDGVNVAKIGLRTLRSRLSIIPQEPILFTGTVRFNLDPFNEHTDLELWTALERAFLKDVVEKGQTGHEKQEEERNKKNEPKKSDGGSSGSSGNGGGSSSTSNTSSSSSGGSSSSDGGAGDGVTENKGLLMRVEENGSNFSVGQRQLLCLARTLVRRTRVIVLDEATAAVDPYTDSCIQKAIREEFQDCTMMTIAHRINTVIDNDLILVLDQGRVAELGSPADLLSQNSIFASLVDALGTDEAQNLRQIAQKAKPSKE